MAEIGDLKRACLEIVKRVYQKVPRKVGCIVMMVDMHSGKTTYAHEGFANPQDLKIIFKACAEQKSPDKPDHQGLIIV